jgi:hypothetical protein
MSDTQLDLATLVADQLAEPKPKWRSRTVVWLIVTVAGIAAAKFGYEVDHDALADIVGLVLSLAGVIGAAVGRAKSMQPITKKGAAQMREKVAQAVRDAQVKIGGRDTGDVDPAGVVRTQVPAEARGDTKSFWSSDNGPFFD